jgi:hypothetical protein
MKSQKWLTQSKKLLSCFSKNDRVTVAKWLSTVARDEISKMADAI